MTVMVKKIGGSVAVVIPKAVAAEMGLVDGSSLEITGSADSIIMRKSGRRPRRRLSTLIPQMNPAAYRKHAKTFLSGKPVGKELW